MENIKSYLHLIKGHDYTGNYPVIIDFYASWCGPCKALAPLLERIAHEYDGVLKVIKFDIDKNEAIADAASIRSVPTLFFVDIDGNIKRHVGSVPYDELKRMAQELIKR